MRRAGCFWALLFLAHSLSAQPVAPPNDPDFALQWSLRNIGQTVNEQVGTPGSDINLLGAWGNFRGTGNVIIGIVDTGVNHHVEFVDRLLEGFVAAGAGGDPYSTLDEVNHGTHLAGIVAAASNNAQGIAGVHSQAWILPIRAFDGPSTSEASMASGIRLAVDNGASVILAGVQLYNDHPDLRSAAEYAVANDVLIVGPVGHLATNSVAFPGAYPGCIAVGATDLSDSLASFSNFGAEVTLVAPSINVWSTWGDDGYGFESNLSAAPAAAIVAGVAALIRSYAPQLSAGQVKQILIDSAVDLGEPGWDEFYGAGRLDAAAALALAAKPPLRFEYVDPIPQQLPPGRTKTFRIRIANGSQTLIPALNRLWLRSAGGQFTQAPALRALGGDLFAVDIPAFNCGEVVDFYLAGRGNGGALVTEPLGAPQAFYQAEAIELATQFDDDFESDRGWTTITEGSQTTGSWARVVPVGTSAQTAVDHTTDKGTMCFVTGQHPGSGGDGANDVDNGPVRLVSPSIAFGTDDAEMSFAVWFHTISGTPDLLAVEISRNGGASWFLAEEIGQSSGWETRIYRLSDFPAMTGNQLRFRFTTSDLPSDSLTEAAIDDFQVVTRDCGALVGDINADGGISLADHVHFKPCMAGPGAGTGLSGCAAADLTQNGRIDLRDWAILQSAFAH